MPAITSFSSALLTLQNELQAALGTDTDFQLDDSQEPPFVDVVRLSSEPSEAERSGRAHVLLSGTDDESPDWGLYARRATITASSRASEFAGALEGVENPEAIQEKMARKITLFLSDQRAPLSELGVLNPRAKRGGSGTTTDKNEATLHFVDTQITFVYLTKEE